MDNYTDHLVLSGDVPPHDEEDGRADEAELNGANVDKVFFKPPELNGAGEEEGCAVLH